MAWLKVEKVATKIALSCIWINFWYKPFQRYESWFTEARIQNRTAWRRRELLAMLANHPQYTATALNLAVAEASERCLPFVLPTAKIVVAERKKRCGWRTVDLFAGLLSLAVWTIKLFEMLRQPNYANMEAAFYLVLLIVAIVSAMFVELTTFQVEDYWSQKLRC